VIELVCGFAVINQRKKTKGKDCYSVDVLFFLHL